MKCRDVAPSPVFKLHEEGINTSYLINKRKTLADKTPSREEVQRPGFATRYEEGTGFTLFPSPEDTTTSEPEIRSSSCRPIAPAPPGHQRPQVSQSLQNWVADRPSGPWSPVQRNDDALHSDHDQSPGNNLRGKYPTDRNYPDKMGEEFGKMEQEKEEKEESEEDGKRRNKKKRARREKRKGHWGMQSDRKLRQRKDGDGDRNGGSGGGQSMTVR